MKKLKHKLLKFFLIFLCLFILLPIFPIYAKEESLFHVYLQESKEGKTIKVLINAKKNVHEDNISGFCCKIQYAGNQLSLHKVEVPSKICGKDLRYCNKNGVLTAVYVCNGKKAPELEGDCAAFVFSVKSGTQKGQLSVGIDQIVTWSGELLNDKYQENLIFEKGEDPNSIACLTTLIPSDGVLVPEFSPKIVKYIMYVPKNLKKLQFYAQAANGGTVRVNRNTINQKKSETLFKITAVSENKKQKQVYLISVISKKLNDEEREKAEKNKKKFLSHMKNEKAVTVAEPNTAEQMESTNNKAKSAPSLFLRSGQNEFFWGVVVGIGFVGCACLICLLIVKKQKK